MSTKDRALHKALLMAKIAAERELISLQTQQILYDIKPSNIKNNLVNNAVHKLGAGHTSRNIVDFVLSRPTMTIAVAKLLTRSLKRSKSSVWRVVALAATAWFVTSRLRSKHRTEAVNRASSIRHPSESNATTATINTGHRIRAHSEPIRGYRSESVARQVPRAYSAHTQSQQVRSRSLDARRRRFRHRV